MNIKRWKRIKELCNWWNIYWTFVMWLVVVQDDSFLHQLCSTLHVIKSFETKDFLLWQGLEISMENHTGATCSWFDRPSESWTEERFHCLYLSIYFMAYHQWLWALNKKIYVILHQWRLITVFRFCLVLFARGWGGVGWQVYIASF